MLSSLPFWLGATIAAILAYFIGGLPFGYWFVRLSLGKDIRTMGSGNIGATNVQRSAGTKAGLIVLALDILKGFLALWLAALISAHNPLAIALATLAVTLGHCYPVTLNFKGGKAVACYVGAALYLSPLSLLASVFVFVAVVALSKHISLGSIVTVAVFPAIYWFVTRPSLFLLIAAVLVSLLIIYRHKGNIERLRAGTENVFSFKGKKP